MAIHKDVQDAFLLTFYVHLNGTLVVEEAAIQLQLPKRKVAQLVNKLKRHGVFTKLKKNTYAPTHPNIIVLDVINAVMPISLISSQEKDLLATGSVEQKLLLQMISELGASMMRTLQKRVKTITKLLDPNILILINDLPTDGGLLEN